MKRRKRMAVLLIAAMLLGTVSTGTVSAAIGQNLHTHDDACGYSEGSPCSHIHDESCYVPDHRICGYDEEEEKTATDSSADHVHTLDCYELDCPHERGEHDESCGYEEGMPCNNQEPEVEETAEQKLEYRRLGLPQTQSEESRDINVRYMGYPKTATASDAGSRLPVPGDADSVIQVSSESDYEVGISEYPATLSDGNITYDRKGILVPGSEALEYTDVCVIPAYPEEGAARSEWMGWWGDGITIVYQAQDESGAISLDIGDTRISLTPAEGTVLPAGAQIRAEDYAVSIEEALDIINGAPDLGFEANKIQRTEVITPDHIVDRENITADMDTDAGTVTVRAGDRVTINGKEYIIAYVFVPNTTILNIEVTLSGTDGKYSGTYDTYAKEWVAEINGKNIYQPTGKLVKVKDNTTHTEATYLEGGIERDSGRRYLYKDGKTAGMIDYKGTELVGYFYDGYAPEDLADKPEDSDRLVIDTSGGAKYVDILFSQNITVVDGSGDKAEVDRGSLVCDWGFTYSAADALKRDYISAHISESGIEYGDTECTAAGAPGVYHIRSIHDLKNGLSPFIVLAVSDYEIPAASITLKPDNGKTDSGSDSGSGSSGSGSGRSTTAAAGRWVQDGTGWWYRYNNGTWPAGGFSYLSYNQLWNWYFFNQDGYMADGWVDWNGRRYYLHPVSDGTRGHMYTGWHEIDGKWYYFNENSDGTKGALMTDTWIGEYYVGPDGAWIENP